MSPSDHVDLARARIAVAMADGAAAEVRATVEDALLTGDHCCTGLTSTLQLMSGTLERSLELLSRVWR